MGEGGKNGCKARAGEKVDEWGGVVVIGLGVKTGGEWLGRW